MACGPPKTVPAWTACRAHNNDRVRIKILFNAAWAKCVWLVAVLTDILFVCARILLPCDDPGANYSIGARTIIKLFPPGPAQSVAPPITYSRSRLSCLFWHLKRSMTTIMHHRHSAVYQISLSLYHYIAQSQAMFAVWIPSWVRERESALTKQTPCRHAMRSLIFILHAAHLHSGVPLLPCGNWWCSKLRDERPAAVLLP